MSAFAAKDLRPDYTTQQSPWSSATAVGAASSGLEPPYARRLRLIIDRGRRLSTMLDVLVDAARGRYDR